jgi:alpha-galactosidase
MSAAFQFNPVTGTFDFIPSSGLSIQAATLHLHYWKQGQLYSEQLDHWTSCDDESLRLPPGALSAQAFQRASNPDGLSARLIFAQAADRLYWQVELKNEGSQTWQIERVELLRSTHGFCPTPANLSFYSNGWQSWSPAAAFPSNQAMPRSILRGLQTPMIYNPGTPTPNRPGHFSSDFFGVLADRSAGQGLVIGFLAQQEQFGSLSARLNDSPILSLWANADQVQLRPGQTLPSDWAMLCPIATNTPDPLAPYLDTVSTWHEIRLPQEVPAGWCSWYEFYQNVTETDIRRNLVSLASMRDRLPIDLLQIDDGFEAQVGDWFDFHPKRFPRGVAGLAAEIRARGMTPGLWLAPFIVHPTSQLAHQHPDWLLRTPKGRPVNAGFVWNAFCQALDLTNPAALEYTAKVIRTAVEEWGYPYLKLDFLYAAALAGRYQDPTRTRAQVLRQGMQTLRQAAGEETFLLGCGAPLGSMLGLVQAMRIGADVGGDWHPHIFGIGLGLRDEPSVPSARVSVRNTLNRTALHRRWWLNDPDCLLVRTTTHLTLPEVQSLASAIALSGGALLISDNLPALSAERRRIAECLLPIIGQRPWVLDWLDSETPTRLRLDLESAAGTWHLLGLFQWQDQPRPIQFDPREFQLPSDDYWVSSFWDERIFSLQAGQTLPLGPMAAHGCALLAVRPKQTGKAQYLGSNLHISQGLEVSHWQEKDLILSLNLSLPRQSEGSITLSLPRAPRDTAPRWKEVQRGIYRFQIRLDRQVALKI